MKGGNFGKSRAPHLRPASGFGKPGLGAPVTKSEAARQQWESDLEGFVDELEANIGTLLPQSETAGKTRGELAFLIDEKILELSAERGVVLPEGERRDVVTVLLNAFLDEHGEALNADPLSLEDQAKKNLEAASKNSVIEARDKIQPQLFEHIDPSAAMEMERADLAVEVSDLVGELLADARISLNSQEQRDVVTLLLNDMLGLGPLEPLLADEAVTDIMVNGKDQTYIERKGKLTLSDVKFRDEQHLLNIATRIVSAVGRRVDETQPICDARLADGSRVNVIIPPLAIDGTSISIRKFSKQKITLDKMTETQNVSPNMCQVLKIAGRCRLNILISGGTGSGKTTMLNAISQMIDEGERVVTIEDAAELQLQQPHVVRLETRPANLEGQGEITMRDLVKNALRMRPDRIILGEIRGGEAIDMLQAMNTGHDGSLGTVHANRPREALTRMENMVNMAGMHLPSKAIRTQIADAVNMIVQVARMRDGKRRVCYVTEVVGMEGEVITTQDLFTYKFTGEDADGNLTGQFFSTGVRPAFFERAEYFGLGRSLMEAMG
ncbi:MAG: CpaF family protein [Pseudomonadota bacterium]